MQLLTDIPHSPTRRAELEKRLELLERPDRVQMLCLALDDPYPIIRHDVAEALQRELDDVLSQWLEAVALGEAPDPGLSIAVRVPEELVPRDSERARIAACVALETSPVPERTAEVMIRLLGTANADLRYQALIALHRIEGATARLHQVLCQVCDGEVDPEILVVASQIALHSGWVDLLPVMLRLRERLRGEDRHQINFSIGELVGSTELTAANLAAADREAIIDECTRALRDERLTAAAARTLVYLDAQEATGALEKVLDRWFGHPILKVEAAAALLDLGHPRGEDYLIKALAHRRKDARGYALRIVGKRRMDRFFPHLVEVASSQEYHADTATLALADFGGAEALQVLAHLATSHPDPEVRELAAEGIHPTPDPDSYDASVN